MSPRPAPPGWVESSSPAASVTTSARSSQQFGTEVPEDRSLSLGTSSSASEAEDSASGANEFAARCPESPPEADPSAIAADGPAPVGRARGTPWCARRRAAPPDLAWAGAARGP
eukprot:3729632-Alexandrium_andersonii.AAC.1